MVNRFVGINTGTSFMIQIISTYRTLRRSIRRFLQGKCYYKGWEIIFISICIA